MDVQTQAQSTVLLGSEGGHVHVHSFKNISSEPIDYSTKLALTGLNGVD